LIPDRGEPVLTVMIPDGTKSPVLPDIRSGSLIVSLHETTDGRILFTESAGGNHDRDLISVL
jgi:hypothetical protein